MKVNQIELPVDVITAVLGCPDLPVMPKTASDLIDYVKHIDRDNHDADYLAHLLKHDMSTASYLLRCANVAMYGSRRVGALEEAITRIGHDNVVYKALGLTLYNTINSCKFSHFIGMKYFWKRSLIAACCARFLTILNQFKEAIFLTALLQDIGVLILSAVYPTYAENIFKIQHDHDAIVHYESSEFGISHSNIGSFIVSYWGLPSSISSGIQSSHCSSSDVTKSVIAASSYIAEYVLSGEKNHSMQRKLN